VKLHVLTAVTRPENLSAIGHSLFDNHDDGWEISWHLMHANQEHVGGQYLKNLMLDEVEDGWVYILDDDTIMHADFQRVTHETISDRSWARALVFAQRRPEGVVQPEMTRGMIDIGQALIRRDAIAETRIPELYDGDGWFLTKVLGGNDVVWIETVLSHYNALRKET
jgi:hypothetical protein